MLKKAEENINININDTNVEITRTQVAGANITLPNLRV